MILHSLSKSVIKALSVLVFSLSSALAAGFTTGPMLGYVTHDSISVWARAMGGGEFKVELSETQDFKRIITGGPVKFDRKRDNTAVVTVKGLKPATKYYWRAFSGGKAYTPPAGVTMTVKTFPPPLAKARLRFGIGSCNAPLRHPESPIWNAVKKENLDAFLWLGDNIYADKQPPFVVTGLYHGMRNTKTMQPVNLTVPHYAIWDDHDFGDNDHDRTLPWKARFLQHFKDWWANPSYGEPDNPGVYYKFTAGPVDFFMLDVRYYRAPNSDSDGPAKTMLGDKQEAWLKRELKASKAPFKILASGSAWNDNRMFIDNWKSHQAARDRLFDFIRDEKISGVILISGDTHVGELNVLPRKDKGGYDLYEFVASPLANGNDPWEEYMKSEAVRVRPVMGDGYNFGLIEVDGTQKNPTVSFELIRPNGARVWKKFTVGLDELSNGHGDWKSKIADMPK